MFNHRKTKIRIAYDLKYVFLGGYTRSDQFKDLIAFLKGISSINGVQFEVNIKAHPSGGDDNKNFQIFKIFKKEFKNLQINFLPKKSSGERWVNNNDIFVSRVSSLQEYAHFLGKINICMATTGDTTTFLKPFSNLATCKNDVQEIFQSILKAKPIPKKLSPKNNELKISNLNIDEYCKSINNLINKS